MRKINFWALCLIVMIADFHSACDFVETISRWLVDCAVLVPMLWFLILDRDKGST